MDTNDGNDDEADDEELETRGGSFPLETGESWWLRPSLDEWLDWLDPDNLWRRVFMRFNRSTANIIFFW